MATWKNQPQLFNLLDQAHQAVGVLALNEIENIGHRAFQGPEGDAVSRILQLDAGVQFGVLAQEAAGQVMQGGKGGGGEFLQIFQGYSQVADDRAEGDENKMRQSLDHGHEAVMFRGGGDLHPGAGLGQEVLEPPEPALAAPLAEHYGPALDGFLPGAEEGMGAHHFTGKSRHHGGHGALLHLTSVKQRPMAAMMSAFPVKWWAPIPSSAPGKKPSRAGPWCSARGGGSAGSSGSKDLLTQAGARVKITTAAEHDRLMAVVQGLAHFILIAFGTVIRDLGVSLEDLEEFSTPTFATLHNLTRHLLSQDPKLYACIQLQNPANRIALRALEGAVADILYFIQRQDADGLVRLIEEIKYGAIYRRRRYKNDCL